MPEAVVVAAARTPIGRSGKGSLVGVDAFTLAEVMPRIRCPLLIVHGAEDRQIPLADAERAFQAATGTAVKELKVFTAAEGGTQHCQLDNRSLAIDYITHWVADHL